MAIPVDLAAKILFLSDRTCCVCRTKGKPVQIHHIDGDNSNNDFKNLAVLCLDCHTETQIQGGFHRKLDPEQVYLYRDDWLNLVARERAASLASSTKDSSTGANLEFITSTAEILRENGQYELLAIYYKIWGNEELRDKYIEKALSEHRPIPAETEIFLRSLQRKTELVDPDRVERLISAMKETRDWSQLARIYVMLGRGVDAVKMYCQSIAEDLDAGRVFSAAFYLKELAEEELQRALFEIALRHETEKGDLWWQVRCLQELGWETEVEQLLISKKEEIERSGNLLLRMTLYKALNDEKKYVETSKKLAQGMRMIRLGEREFPAIPKANEETGA